MKPIYKIAIVTVVVLLLAITTYFVWQRLTPVPSPTRFDAVNGAPVPAPPTGTPLEPRRVSTYKVFDYGIFYDTKSIFYLAPEGKVYKAKAAGEDAPISNQTVNALNKIEFSPAGEKILAAFGDPRQPQWGIFDLIDKVWRPLPAGILNAVWGADVNELITITSGDTGTNLSRLDLSKNPPERKIIVKDFRLKDIDLVYFGGDNLLIAEKPSITYKSRVWLFNLKNFAIQEFLNSDWGLMIKKSAVNNKPLLFRSSLGSNLLIFNDEFKQVDTPFLDTLPLKCGAAEDQIFCFLPDLNSLETDSFPAKLLDGYLTGKVYTIDSLIIIEFDLLSREIKKISSPWINTFDAPFDALNPQYLDGSIYFINRYDNFLYELKL
jgi:hypothetical protein